MNMDYSKVFELLNQDAEKERNKKAEKAVHDNLYNKGFRDGLAVLDKIRAEIEHVIDNTYDSTDYDKALYNGAYKDGLYEALDIIHKYTDKENKDGSNNN